MSITVRLWVMMFLQYAIWGSWSPVLSEYLLTDLGYSGTQVGFIYSLLPLATIISPFIGGQLADRYFSSEKVIAFFQITGGIVLLAAARATDFSSVAWLMFLYCLLYAPTLALTNSIAFINLKDSEREFGIVRVGGTIGWIVAGFGLTAWRVIAKSNPSFDIAGDTLLLGGVVSILMGFFSFMLPHTPPNTREAETPWAFLKAFKMLKNPRFAVFMVISFIVSTELMFYYILTAPFITSETIGVDVSTVAGVMAIAQFAEIFVMAVALPFVLPKIGIRKTMIIGVIAWPIRYIIFAIGAPAWLVIASLALHGFCYVFFFTVSFIYVDMVAPRDIRHSAQGLITFVSLGLGMYFGSLFAGYVKSYFTTQAGTNWTGVFIVPAILTIIAAIVFTAVFRENAAGENAEETSTI